MLSLLLSKAIFTRLQFAYKTIGFVRTTLRRRVDVHVPLQIGDLLRAYSRGNLNQIIDCVTSNLT